MNHQNITPQNIYSLYKFLVELLTFCGLFVVRLPRRDHYVRRAAVSLLACFLISSYWTRALSSFEILTVLRYLILFFAVTMTVWQSFRCGKRVALACAMGGYAAQHLFHKVYDIVDLLTGPKSGWAELILYPVLWAAALLFVWFVFARHLSGANYQSMEDPKNSLLCGIVLLCTIFFSVIYVTYADETVTPMLVVCSLYDCVCCVMALWVQFGLFQLNRAKEERVIAEQLWRQEKKQLAISRENIDLINIKCHDMKHMISRLAAKGDLKAVQDLVEIYDFSVDTGSDILNLILAEKSLLCQEQGIRINCIADGGKLDFMEDSDIYSLFGNALDNSITAAQRLDDRDRRIITLTIKSALGMVSICIENYYKGKLSFEDGLPVTSKEDKDYHGFGLKSIRYLVRKYHGEMTVKADGGIFTMSILLPLE